MDDDIDIVAALYNRSESRCSRSSVNTIDDVQQYFDLAIAAGESQLRNEQGEPSSHLTTTWLTPLQFCSCSGYLPL